MAQQITTSYDFGNLNVSVGTATEDAHAVNKAQLDTQITSATNYTDTKDAQMKIYVDNAILGLGEYVGTLDPASGLPTTGSGEGGSIDKNDYWVFSENGTLLGEEVHKYEKLIANVSDADEDSEFRVEHMPEIADTRYEFLNQTVPATVQETVGNYVLSIDTALVSGETLTINDIDIVADGNLDVVTNNTATEQATKIKELLDADVDFNAQYTITDDLSGTLTIIENANEATGTDLVIDETAMTTGDATLTINTNSVAYDLGNLVVAHGLGYKYVQVIASNATTGLQLLTPPKFIDTNSLEFINESNSDIVISGVISI